MDHFTQNLRGASVYIGDIVVSDNNAEQHLQNLKRLLQRLPYKGLRCRLEKRAFAQPYVEYLGHYLSKNGINEVPKADAVKKMPAPINVSSLRSFMGQVQFYSKFLPSLSNTLEPL
ncbi:retrovirus-related Pol polyprotein [Elysia marginata]|uniref:Retrovirus-related Pol polyprotein n=1 Tax=Elysia marginata TaxID=1093978 RepID=A0AAV4FMH5_9GAST|nr:retrovirus-related Pol polyprotein [Elysia marginata]